MLAQIFQDSNNLLRLYFELTSQNLSILLLALIFENLREYLVVKYAKLTPNPYRNIKGIKTNKISLIWASKNEEIIEYYGPMNF